MRGIPMNGLKEEKMLQILGNTNQELIATKAEGLLTTKDYQKVRPFFHNAASMKKKVSWYFEMGHFKGWEAQSFWEDLMTDGHMKEIDKVALIGVKEWNELIMSFLKKQSGPEIRSFEKGKKALALKWLSDNT